MEDMVLLDAGSGGAATQRLIRECFAGRFSNPILDEMDDAALLPDMAGRLAVSTDSFTVTPLFFPGGSIGSLAVYGTVNDVAMRGARPLYLACGFIIEEGLPLTTLRDIAGDMASAAREAHVSIIAGDTKVVPRGACDGLFINTTGIGRLIASPAPAASCARPGDAILVSGSMGDHGLTVLASREDLAFLSGVRSDSAPLAGLACDLASQLRVHVLRDPTRGGLATTLNEIAAQSGVGMEIEESAVPVHEPVRSACSFLGLDPLYLANEGKLICIVPSEQAADALNLMRGHKYGAEAAIIGKVTKDSPGRVTLVTPIGGRRVLAMPEGALLPRIC